MFKSILYGCVKDLAISEMEVKKGTKIQLLFLPTMRAMHIAMPKSRIVTNTID
jgi:hypothetical protein